MILSSLFFPLCTRSTICLKTKPSALSYFHFPKEFQLLLIFVEKDNLLLKFPNVSWTKISQSYERSSKSWRKMHILGEKYTWIPNLFLHQNTFKFHLSMNYMAIPLDTLLCSLSRAFVNIIIHISTAADSPVFTSVDLWHCWSLCILPKHELHVQISRKCYRSHEMSTNISMSWCFQFLASISTELFPSSPCKYICQIPNI